MKSLIYALIIIMVIDAFLLAYFVIRLLQKKRLKANNVVIKSVKEKDKTKEGKTEKTKPVGEKQKKVESKTAEKSKPKNKLTKHSSFGKIKVNEEALKEILAGYDKAEALAQQKDASEAAEIVTAPSEKVATSANGGLSETKKNTLSSAGGVDAVFEDFKLEESAEDKQEVNPGRKSPRFSSQPNRFGHRTPNLFDAYKKTSVPKIEEVSKHVDDLNDDNLDDDDDDFDTSDIEKAYQDFLNRKKQEYLKKYEDDMDIGEDDTFDDEDDFDKPTFSRANNVSEKKYTLADFKEDYFKKHLDIATITKKLSEEDKNKILDILLRKNTIEESDFE